MVSLICFSCIWNKDRGARILVSQKIASGIHRDIEKLRDLLRDYAGSKLKAKVAKIENLYRNPF